MAIEGYKDLTPFRFWCQKVLPTVYDESLSYYELLCKVVEYLNETMDDVTILHDEFVELKTFVDSYFENLDVQEEINNKLDEMAANGSLDTLIQKFIPHAVSDWLEEYFHPSEPSAVSLDTSLMISNSAADSKAAGDAIFGASRNNVVTRNAIALTAMAKFTPNYETMTSITEMPPYTWMQGTGEQIAAIIPGKPDPEDENPAEDPFPWRDELKAYPNALYISNNRDRNSVNYTWEISTNYGHVLYRGYSAGPGSRLWQWKKGLTMIESDASLSVDGAAADAKATGDSIFGVERNNGATKSKIALTAMAKFTPNYATMTSITEMPPYTWMQGTGEQIAAIIPGGSSATDPFPWRDELRSYPYTLYVSNRQGRSATNYTWEISTNYGNVLYRGYNTGETGSTWVWSKGLTRISSDASLSVDGAAADAKATGDSIFGVERNNAATKSKIALTAMAKFTPNYATMTSITEMPPYTWMQGTGEQIAAIIPRGSSATDPFPWRDELSKYPYTLYVSNRQGRSATNYTWEISTNYGNVLYSGYNTGDTGSAWVWGKGLTRISSDASLTIEGAAADAKATGDAIETAKEKVTEFMEEPNPVARELYTDFYDESKEDPTTHVATYWNGWYNYAGGISGASSLKHSEKFRIRPGVRYYTSNYSATNNRVIGVFFDRDGHFLKPLFGAIDNPPTSNYVQLTEYAYEKAYRGASFVINPDNYVKIYTFIAPSDAYYMGLNLQGGEPIKNNDINEGRYSYKNYVASFPIFAGLGMGNVIIRENDPFYQKTKDKKLMVLGPSTVMIDRLLRPAEEPPADSGRYQQYIIGAQEYLCPWYAAVESYGYSGAGWGYGTTPGSTTSIGAVSIYTRVFGGTETVYNNLHKQEAITVDDDKRVNFSEYDEYLIFTNSNGTTVANVGTIDSTVTVDGVEVLDKTKQMSALHAIVREIITQNKRAKIYLCGQRYRNYPYDDPSSEARRPALITMYEESKKLAVRYSLNFIDMNDGTSLNPMVNYEKEPGLYYYDSIHPSNLGNQRIGLWMRQNILGF